MPLYQSVVVPIDGHPEIRMQRTETFAGWLLSFGGLRNNEQESIDSCYVPDPLHVAPPDGTGMTEVQLGVTRKQYFLLFTMPAGDGYVYFSKSWVGARNDFTVACDWVANT